MTYFTPISVRTLQRQMRVALGEDHPVYTAICQEQKWNELVDYCQKHADYLEDLPDSFFSPYNWQKILKDQANNGWVLVLEFNDGTVGAWHRIGA